MVMADVETQVQQADTEAPQAEGADAPVQEGDVPGDVAPAVEPAVVDESPPEPLTLDAILEQHPHLRDVLSERDRDRENAGAQRREAQLRREAGTKEQTKANTERILREFGVEDVDPTKINFVYDLASSNAAYQLAQEFPNALMSQYQIAADVREQALERREANDWDGYVSALIDGAVSAKTEEIRAQIREEERVAAREYVNAELKAQQVEGGPQVSAPPATPVGAPVGTSPVTEFTNFADLTQAYNEERITREEYGRQRAKFVKR